MCCRSDDSEPGPSLFVAAVVGLLGIVVFVLAILLIGKVIGNDPPAAAVEQTAP